MARRPSIVAPRRRCWRSRTPEVKRAPIRSALPWTTTASPDQIGWPSTSSWNCSRTLPGGSASSGGAAAANPEVLRSSSARGPTKAESHRNLHSRWAESSAALRRAGRKRTAAPRAPSRSSCRGGGVEIGRRPEGGGESPLGGGDDAGREGKRDGGGSRFERAGGDEAMKDYPRKRRLRDGDVYVCSSHTHTFFHRGRSVSRTSSTRRAHAD